MKQESAPIHLKGQKEWPAEWESIRDERTGARMTRLTGFRCINHPLYYLTNSFTRDGKWMVFASDRAGRMDLYRVNLATGLIQRLTDLAGLQPFSGNVVDDEVYFSTAGQMHRLNLEDGTETVLADCPGANFGEVTVSCDRKWAAALITRNDGAGILITRTDGSAASVILEGVRALYHPQFHPLDPDQLIYSADPPDPRIWTVRRDGTGDRCVYSNPADTWFVHETFLGKTENIIFSHWHHGICMVGHREGVVRTIAKISAWHVRSSPDGRHIVCDTHLPDIGLCLVDSGSGEYRVLCFPGASNQGYQWKEPLPLGASGAAPGWQTMVETARGETAYGPQWSHPHPSFSPDGRLVSYTSDAGGWPQAYVLEL